ncbi:MAG: hypothetical protein MK207_14985 [Saprospiraceae bacterium]|nr:hypothetical protein [Saprospiraceae bacterium]
MNDLSELFWNTHLCERFLYITIFLLILLVQYFEKQRFSKSIIERLIFIILDDEANDQKISTTIYSSNLTIGQTQTYTEKMVFMRFVAMVI